MNLPVTKPGLSFGPRLAPSPHSKGAVLSYSGDVYYLNINQKWIKWEGLSQHRAAHIFLKVPTELMKIC